jgi:hypothetical protein
VAAEISDRMQQVLDTLARQLTPSQAMAELGMSRSQFGTNVRKLRERGIVRRRDDLPLDAAWSQEYPYVLTGAPTTYRPAMPPEARLRLAYPVDSQRDLTVPPHRHVAWRQWSVQSAPLLNLDGSSGRSASDRTPEFRVVVATDLAGLQAQPDEVDQAVGTFIASVRRRWSETATRNLGWEGDEGRDMTLVIACAVGVEAVLDITKQ